MGRRSVVERRGWEISQPKHTAVFTPVVCMVLMVLCTKLTGFRSPTCDYVTVPSSDDLTTSCCAWELVLGMLSFSVFIRLDQCP